MTVEHQLLNAITVALKALFQIDADAIALEKTNEKFEGDFTFVVFPFLRQAKGSPEQTADKIGKYLVENDGDLVSSFNVVKGFLNLELHDLAWLNEFSTALTTKSFGANLTLSDQKIMVEFSSPNTNKPLHLGHVRNNVLGESISRILKASGADVVKANLINDRGIHICKSMVAWLRFGEGETPSSAEMKGDHFVGKYYVKFDQEYKAQVQTLMASGVNKETAEKDAELLVEAREMLKKWENNDPETVVLWKTMNSWVYAGFELSYSQMGISFDQMYYESKTYLLGKDMIMDGVAKGVFYQKEDQSVWVDLSDIGLDHKILLRSDGTSVYITQDIGTARLKYQDHNIDRSIYVVGNEQEYHFKVLAEILKKLGEPYADGIYHMSYGMVDLPSGKMKSREGTVVDADDLMDQMIDFAKQRTEELGKTDGMTMQELSNLHHILGMGALKFYLLKIDAKKRMMFNPEESIDFNGNTGPFIQYTNARINSILKKAGQVSIQTYKGQITTGERDLIKVLSEYPQSIVEASKTMNPAVIAAAVYQVAKGYNRFYHDHPILMEEDQELKAFRIQLSALAGRIITSGLYLLGIDAPSKM